MTACTCKSCRPGRYVFMGVDLSGVPYDIDSSDDLEEMLRRRDVSMDNRRGRTVDYMVYDRDDQEAGYAEWCDTCPGDRWRGCFGVRQCDECEAVPA
jgi:hypothetical protein